MSFIDRQKRIIGSSHGVVCLSPDYYSCGCVLLWNPTIRKSVVIDVPPDAPNVLDYLSETIIGFGVCPHTNDTKLVKVTLMINDESEYMPWQQVEVFSLSQGVWRSPLCNNMPRESISLTWYQVAIDRYIYWRAFGDGESEMYNLIMSFDMISEEFTQICLPDSLVPAALTSLSLFERMESLAVLENDYSHYTMKKNVWNVWMMMKDGVPKSFTKLYTIETPDASLEKVLGFNKSGEPIILMRKDSEDHDAVFVYDPRSKHVTYIGISGKSGKHYSFSASPT